MRRHMMVYNSAVLILVYLWVVVSISAFTLRPLPYNYSYATTKHTTTKLNNAIGDIFSGITGIPPSTLQPPTDILQGTSIDPARSDVELGRIYKATKDGWSAINFHNCVDGKGSCLVVALSKSGKRFGGFNPLGWMSTDDYGNSNAAFLWFDKGVGGNNKARKCPILVGGNTAIYDFASAGPTFGAADLQIGPPKAQIMGGFTGPDMENTSAVAGDLRRGKASVGGCYNYITGWPVAGEFGLAEVEVYCNLNVGKRSRGGGGLFGF